MRIIAGTLGGRLFDSPHTDHTHPMSDKIRGALFNALGELDGLTVLDAFAGTGALGFEAMSRGAAEVLAIESDASAQGIIARNVTNLGLKGQFKLVHASADSWLGTYEGPDFDVVLLDPPYNDVQPDLINKLSTKVNDDGLLVLSWPATQEIPALPNLNVVKQRQYGDAQLVYYQR